MELDYHMDKISNGQRMYSVLTILIIPGISQGETYLNNL